MKTMCSTCRHDKNPGGCEFACAGVVGWDEVNEVVTSCQDYEERYSMTVRERAIQLLEREQLAHVIYGYRANRETVEASWENEMLRFYDDDSFAEHIDKMQAEIDGLEMVLAVHRR